MSNSNFSFVKINLFALSLGLMLLTIVSLQAQNASFDEGVTLIEIPDESNGLNHPALPMDYNEDGITDIMTASEDLFIYEGLGNNEFLIIDDLNATNNPLKTIDFDNDGDLYIIMRRYINIKESDGTYSMLNPSVPGSIIEVADFD